ncbi:diguanylate cyclase domain-containing protein [Dechloromonas denitrificans]|uniref:GGDEF domain-containing response regulator n=1 Tax=Dechloromonas denitrificans TaxID=281362 RepID=UPI001CF8C5A3|nr:diguanylate cyclase [Dechloromonas denitrificans]UCV05407.1 diguanylate cyclase [Dechloromonas denitrificans]
MERLIMHGRDMTSSQKVLLVDASRVVRASLSRYLRDSYEVCEEGDGESAWQSLVLDSSIVAVISGLDIAGLDGSGLIERLRASKLARLNRLPFFLLVSDSFAAAAKERALQLGVSDFIPKGMAAKAAKQVCERLSASSSQTESAPGLAEFGSQSDIGLSDFMSRIGTMAGLADELVAEGGGEQPADTERPERRLTKSRSEQCLQDLLASTVGSEPVGVLVFAIDGYDDLKSQYGREVADRVVMKFSRLLSGKIRGEESIGQLADGRIAIVSPTADREQCANFAWRVCRALAAAQVSVHGQRIETTVSAGVAAKPEDSATASTEELLRLAISRLDGAIRAGGNRVVHASGCGGNNVDQEEFFARLRALLANATPDTMMSCKGWVTSVCVACRKSMKAGNGPACPSGAAGGKCVGKSTERSV